ncbi:GGDEF domain-containing protein [Pseudorhodoferax sp.]|uniref:GGDEF domain-containing protein n=1 Tax=Pseudorhodoferax sp. TaxID=1993553 RepID=UPI002DD6A13D|nr:sensor domain-containing diguanylate cyclase [Pseudorhodoferax sp.]
MNLSAWWNRLFSPAVRIALGLVSLMVTLVLLGEMFTGYPTDRGELLSRYHSQVARTLGQQVAGALSEESRDDKQQLQRVLAQALHNEPRLLSARVVDANARVLGQVGDHQRGWHLAAGVSSTLDNIRIPLLVNGQRWGELQIVMQPMLPNTLAGWLREPLVHWFAFISLAGLLVYALYLRRVLRHLDPNAAVPERVRTAFDTLTEGVLVLDPLGRVMLANQAFTRIHGEQASALTGKAATELPWLLASLPDDQRAPPPWRRAVQDKAAVLGVPLHVLREGVPPLRLVLNCSPITDGGRVRGCLASLSDVTELQERTERLHVALEDLSISQKEIERQNEELTLLATRDALTGIFNRRSLMQQAEQRFAEARAAGTPISCIMCDIDHFKSVNDKYGHAGGDQVIQGAAKALSRGLRLHDFVGRYGGEEFCVMLPGSTLAQAREVAERLREDIAANLGAALRDHAGVRVTMSFGAAELEPGMADPGALIDLADQALYHSKKNGRNRVTAWRTEDTETAGAVA